MREVMCQEKQCLQKDMISIYDVKKRAQLLKTFKDRKDLGPTIHVVCLH